MSEACLNLIKFGGIEAMPPEVDRCYPMTPVRHWHGLWRDVFEEQRFYPFLSSHSSHKALDDKIWIEFKPGSRPFTGSPTGKTYSISFLGRRTRVVGHYGHLGMSPHVIVVDRLISISPAQADPSKR